MSVHISLTSVPLWVLSPLYPRTALELAEGLRNNMPTDPRMFSKRVSLEEVVEELYENLYEEASPQQIVRARKAKGNSAVVEDEDEKGESSDAAATTTDADPDPEDDDDDAESLVALASQNDREFLVEWFEPGVEPSWVPLKHLAPDLVEDFDGGLEYAEAEEILDKRVRTETGNFLLDGKEEETVQITEYLVNWKDDYPQSWEPEDNIAQEMLEDFNHDPSQTKALKVVNEGGSMKVVSQ
mmetsp:Transcript_2132/g.4936  ORF Transcript_2132/g.4936 Transcript_2132/m.4936 type:complete len:241 (+) Transcript_2132:674-1396(+)